MTIRCMCVTIEIIFSSLIKCQWPDDRKDFKTLRHGQHHCTCVNVSSSTSCAISSCTRVPCKLRRIIKELLRMCPRPVATRQNSWSCLSFNASTRPKRTGRALLAWCFRIRFTSFMCTLEVESSFIFPQCNGNVRAAATRVFNLGNGPRLDLYSRHACLRTLHQNDATGNYTPVQGLLPLMIVSLYYPDTHAILCRPFMDTFLLQCVHFR